MKNLHFLKDVLGVENFCLSRHVTYRGIRRPGAVFTTFVNVFGTFFIYEIMSKVGLDGSFVPSGFW